MTDVLFGAVVDEDKCKAVDVYIDESRSTETMKLYELARWHCLIEAVDIIGGKAEELEARTHKKINWVKPIPIQKYIDERTPSMLYDMARDRKEKSVFVPSTKCTTS